MSRKVPWSTGKASKTSEIYTSILIQLMDSLWTILLTSIFSAELMLQAVVLQKRRIHLLRSDCRILIGRCNSSCSFLPRKSALCLDQDSLFPTAAGSHLYVYVNLSSTLSSDKLSLRCKHTMKGTTVGNMDPDPPEFQDLRRSSIL